MIPWNLKLMSKIEFPLYLTSQMVLCSVWRHCVLLWQVRNLWIIFAFSFARVCVLATGGGRVQTPWGREWSQANTSEEVAAVLEEEATDKEIMIGEAEYRFRNHWSEAQVQNESAHFPFVYSLTRPMWKGAMERKGMSEAHLVETAVEQRQIGAHGPWNGHLTLSSSNEWSLGIQALCWQTAKSFQ